MTYPEEGTPEEFKAAVMMYVATGHCANCESTFITDVQDYRPFWWGCYHCKAKRKRSVNMDTYRAITME